MSKVESRREQTPFEDTFVVDCDVHTSKRDPEILREKLKYMEEPYKSQLDPDKELFNSPYPSDGWPRSIAATNMEATTMSVTDPEEGIREPLIEEFGIDNPIVNMAGGQDRIPETERAVQEMRADNKLLMELFLDDNPDFFGVIDICTRKPAESAEEIDRYGDEDQIVGVYVSTQGANKPMGHPDFDIIHQAAEDNGLTVLYHGGAAAMVGQTPIIETGLETFLEVHAVSHPWQQMINLTSLIIQGVPEKFPDLNHVFVESGLGWVPYMMARMNREYGQRRSDAPLLQKSPEEYVRENCYFATQPFEEYNDPTNNVKTMEMVGTDNIVFSTDHPHFDFDNPTAVDKFYRKFSEEERKQMLHGNAIEAFDLPLSP